MNTKTSGVGQEPITSRLKRVRLACPLCGFRVGDTPSPTRISVRLADIDPAGVADLYIKCGRCKSELAARKIE